MSLPIILSAQEIDRFDSPPKLQIEERSFCFEIDSFLSKTLSKLKTDTNKAGFFLNYGYFKASKKFFSPKQFRRKDLTYICRILNLNANEIDFFTYQPRIYSHHKSLILQHLGWKPFEEKYIAHFQTNMGHINVVSTQEFFSTVIEFLQTNKIEIPGYWTLAFFISKPIADLENRLLKDLKNLFDRNTSDVLPDVLEEFSQKIKANPDVFKKIDASLRPMRIRESLKDFEYFKSCFHALTPILQKLALPHSSIEYYATWIYKAEVVQLKSLQPSKLHLYLICYIQHQYCLRQDALVDIFLRCVQSSLNAARRQQRKIITAFKDAQSKEMNKIIQQSETSAEVLEEVSLVVKDPDLMSEDKLFQIEFLVDTWKSQNTLGTHVKSLKKIEQKSNWFDVLEGQSIRLQFRVSSLLRLLEFNPLCSSFVLLKTIDYFKSVKGDVTPKAPTAFLNDKERKALTKGDIKGDVKGESFRVSLYKIFLFIHVAEGIKSGKLNLIHSYRYKSLEEYLIDAVTWETQKESLIKQAGIEEFMDFNKTIEKLKGTLEKAYDKANASLKDNLFVSFDPNGKIKVATPKVDNDEMQYISSLLKEPSQTSIYQVLSTVEEVTGFSKSFKHFSLKYSKMKPTFKTLCAGIMGLGLNHGVHRMALISEGISEKVLRNTINWFFTLSNIEAAYDTIVNKIGTLSLSNLYLHKENQLVTGSDGRKIPVAVDSLNANHSYKFPGKGSVVTFYGFLDSKQRQFYNTVFTSTNREAGYVIDGLLHNDTVKSDIHSTDTHGYMESVFTISHFVPAMFAPRLKNLKDQQIYSFEPRKYYVQKGYKILPCKRFNLKQIEDEWDPFLRFIVTIKLKHTPASQLLKRLSSYARDNPLYKALKEFGRIIKSIYILTYIQDKELRQMVQKTLNYVEQSNKFTKAISFANNQEFQYGTKEEQQVMAACTTLLQNAIVLWNYLTLSKKILAVADPKVRQKMINRMKKGSLLCWSYLNFQGEYNFSEKALKKNIFDMEKIKKLKI